MLESPLIINDGVDQLVHVLVEIVEFKLVHLAHCSADGLLVTLYRVFGYEFPSLLALSSMFRSILSEILLEILIH